MKNQTIDETYTIMYICGMLACVEDKLAELPDSDNKLELIKWLNVSTTLLKGITCDGYTVVEETAEEVVDANLS